MIASLTVHLILAASPAADPSTCAPTDYRCTAETNVAAARGATSDGERAQRLYRAHRAYLALARSAARAERARTLCRAVELLGQVRALSRPESLRQRIVDTTRETEDVLADAGVDCPPSKKPRKVTGRRVATASTTTTRTSVERQDPPSVSESTPVLLDVGGSRPAASHGVRTIVAPSVKHEQTSTTVLAGRMNATPSSTSAIDHGPRADEVLPGSSSPSPVRSGRGLVIAGGVTLGAGVALVAAAGVLGYRMSETREEVLALDGMLDGFASEEEAAQGDALVRDYRTMGSQTLALALTGGATVIVAAILTGVGAKRMARRASRTALVPVPGGLALRGRF